MAVPRRVVPVLLVALVGALLTLPSFAQTTGGTLVIGRGADAVTLSFYASAAPDSETMAHVVETLFKLTPGGKDRAAAGGVEPVVLRRTAAHDQTPPGDPLPRRHFVRRKCRKVEHRLLPQPREPRLIPVPRQRGHQRGRHQCQHRTADDRPPL